MDYLSSIHAGFSTPLVQMPNYSAVERLFKEQKSLEDCVDRPDIEPSEREPSPFCALAAMLVLAQGNFWMSIMPFDGNFISLSFFSEMKRREQHLVSVDEE